MVSIHVSEFEFNLALNLTTFIVICATYWAVAEFVYCYEE
jgi:hypothetical protein